MAHTLNVLHGREMLHEHDRRRRDQYGWRLLPPQNDEFERLSQKNWGWYVDTRDRKSKGYERTTQTMFRTGTLDLTAAQVSSKAWLFVRNSQEDAVTLRPRRRPRKPRRPGAHRCLTVDGIERPVTTLCSGV